MGATMFQGRLPRKNAETFPDSSARTFPRRSATTCRGRSVAMCRGSSASRCQTRSAKLLSLHMEGRQLKKSRKQELQTQTTPSMTLSTMSYLLTVLQFSYLFGHYLCNSSQQKGEKNE